MRIAVGGIEHESSSFSPVETPLSAFLAPGRFFDSNAILERSGEANTIVDGFLRGVRRVGADIVPLIWCDAPSGAQPTRETHETVKELLLQPLREAERVDGVLLSLHGSYSAEGLDDADGDILADVRRIVGPDCPVVAVHDLHCNISEAMVQHATALIVEDTYPHVDMAERGEEAADLLAGIVRGDTQPKMAWRSLPLFWAAPRMITAEQPMRTAMEQVFQIEKQPGVLTASLALGYQWADVKCAGASVVVVTDNDAKGAQKFVDTLAQWVWQRRKTWQCPFLLPVEALTLGEAAGKHPIILADQADNPGGGAPGDSTEILRLFVHRDLQEAAVLYIVDPETVKKARAAGVGAFVDVDVGGKSHPIVGPPVPMRVEVLATSDGHFIYDGPMWSRLAGYHGDSVLLKHRGVYVCVITVPNQPVDLAFPRTLGLDCRRLRYLCVKSTGHFRSGFEPIAGSIFNVDAAGVLAHDLTKLPFRRLGRKVYPVHADAVFTIHPADEHDLA